MEKSIVNVPKAIGFLAMLLIFSNCSGEVEQKPEKTSIVFFDLKGYFESEATRLNRIQPNGIKSIAFQDERDTVRMDADEPVNFKEELKAFTGSDINRVAWESKYRVDSLRKEGKLVQLTYTATDSHLKTRQIKIYFREEAIREVQIHNTLKSLIAWSDQYLTYVPSHGYEVKGQQHIRFGKSYAFRANVLFDQAVDRKK